MDGVTTFLNLAGKSFVEFAFVMLVQSSLLIVVLLGLELVLRKRVRAVLRYYLWMLILVKLVLPTTLSSPTGLAYWVGDKLPGILPAKSVASEESETTMPGNEPLEALPIREVRVIALPTDRTNPETMVAGPVESGRAAGLSITWEAVVLLTWLAGVITMTLLLIQRMFFVRGLVAQSKDATDKLSDMLEQCSERLGIRRAVALKMSPVAASPSICGLFRPTILVPQALSEKLNTRQLKSILLHELAHIKRGDLWVSFIQTVLQIVYIYNPLLWVANVIIRKIREEAVDETVLVAMGEQAEDYPETLLSVSKLAFRRPALSLRLIGVAESKKALIGRIEYIAGRPFPKKAKLGLPV
jgi:beta-lactamase regulating signal transducer with metallopeptidase domain